MQATRLGKSEARARFLPLVEAVAAGGAPVEITDRGKVAAVLMSHQEYLRLLACAHEKLPTRSPVGTVEVLVDLETDTTTTRLLLEGLERRAADL